MQEITRERPLVLVVDDEEDMRILAGAQLRDGYEVLSADNGAHCVELARTERPDVILLDMMMPGMSGADVLRVLGEADSTKDIPVVVLSALTAIEDRVKGLEEGAVDWISKPVESRELVARVGVAARTRVRQQELRSRLAFDRATGLGDRSAFHQRLAHEVARSDRSSAPLSILLIDIDAMAGMNDRWGNAIGDELIQLVADELRNILRTSDGIYRYEGDDFAAVLPDTDMSTAFLAAERCRRAIMEMATGRGDLTISVGVAEFSPGRKPEDLVAKAQIALLHAKGSGGNRSWRADDPRRHSLNPIALSEDLTEREWDILGHLANRRTEVEVARRMGIRPGTVRSHKARIRRKLHVDPDVRLSDFARSNFRQLVERLERIKSLDTEMVS
ncbi:MAG: diguanylate cyclase [Actinomycetota bacterium]|nr:diguanylate cyclase [Actinomycetota bacterium]